MDEFDFFTYNDFDFKQNFIHWIDFFLLVIYLIFFYLIAYLIRVKYFRNHPGKKYFLPALTAKIMGAIMIALIYTYYYNGGDTTAYYNDARLLIKTLFNNPNDAISIFFSDNKNESLQLAYYYKNFRFLTASDTLMVVKISALLQLLTFNSFLVTSALFGFLSFFCIWSLYSTFCKINPEMVGKMALSTLFVPSLVIWGSGIFKDTICISLLALTFVKVYPLAEKFKLTLSTLFIVIISTVLIVIIKPYIFLIFSLSFLLYLAIKNISKVKNPLIKVLIAPILLLSSVVIGYYSFTTIGETNKLYSSEQILETAETTAKYLTYISSRDESSGYTLGDVEYTPLGLIKSLPEGINVTLFRPYLWESKKPIMLLSALESFAFVVLTLKLFWFRNPIKVIKVVLKDNLIIFLLIFSLIFSFVVGITTFNFGTLVRYKIIALPFYLCAIFMIEHKLKKRSSSKFIKN